MKFSQSNFKLRLTDCYLIPSYLIATVHSSAQSVYATQVQLHLCYGGFQLLDLIITELKSHMTCYHTMPLIG